MSINLQPTLENDFLLIRPLHEDDFDALYQVAKDPLIWDQHWAYDRYQRKVFTQFFEDAIQSKGALVVIDKAKDEIIGSSRYKMVKGTESAVEIGWTFLARKYWGGRYNKSVKEMMINHAFQSLDDVVLYVAKENLRSQKAVLKIGGVKITDAKHQHLMKEGDTHFTYRIDKSNWNRRV